MMNLCRTLALAFGFLTVWHVPALLPRPDVAASKPQSQPSEEVSSQLYSRHVQPLFEEHCQACHSEPNRSREDSTCRLPQPCFAEEHAGRQSRPAMPRPACSTA